MKVIEITVISIVLLLALVLTFKAKFILEKIFGTEPEEGMVLRVKYIALGLAVIAFLVTFFLLR